MRLQLQDLLEYFRRSLNPDDNTCRTSSRYALCGVMNSNSLPSGVVLPPWASEHLVEKPAHNMLLMLRDVDYIGGGQTIPMAKMNGQTSACNALPPQITEHIRRMERFHPPIQSQSSTAIWQEGIGPGRKCCVYFNEEEP